MSEGSSHLSAFSFQMTSPAVQVVNTESESPGSPGTAVAAGTDVESQSFQMTELDLPVSTAGILLLLGSVAVLMALTVRTALRDSRFLNARNRASPVDSSPAGAGAGADDRAQSAATDAVESHRKITSRCFAGHVTFDGLASRGFCGDCKRVCDG